MHTHEVLLEKICESDIFHVEGGTQQRLFALKAAIDMTVQNRPAGCPYSSDRSQ